MAQTGYTPISIYYSSTATNVPTAGNLVAGELAINTADGKLFYKDSAGVVQVIAGKGGAGVAAGSNTQVQYNSSGSLAGSSAFTFDGTNLTLAAASAAKLYWSRSGYYANWIESDGTVGAGFMRFATGNAEAMRIDSSGNVGIGTTSPQGKLAISAAGAQGLEFLTSSATSIGIQSYNRSTSAYIDQAYVGSVFTWTTGGVGERMRIDSSGNVGIGTSSPAGKLDVAGNMYVNNLASSPTGGIYLGQSGYRASILWNVSTGNLDITPRSGFDTVFTAGNLNVGQTSGPNGSSKLGISNDCGVQAMQIWTNTASGTATQNIVLIYRNASLSGYIQASSTGVNYATSSDYRLKENIAPMTGALEKVAQLKPCTYKWKIDGSEGQGFIAHELQEVVPECVSGEKDGMRTEQYEISPAIKAEIDADGKVIKEAIEAVIGEREIPMYQGIDTSFLVATLTAAIQEQQVLINNLTTRLTALENK